MNKHEQARRFTDKSTKAARETVERGASALEDSTRGGEKSFSSSLAGMRELNIKLIDMARKRGGSIRIGA
jgi:hypothetical protein